MAKRYEELTIADDFMFGKVMEDMILCRDSLERLLQDPVGQLEGIQTQRGFHYTSDGKPVRLDVYTRDRKRIYDAEMQNRNGRRNLTRRIDEAVIRARKNEVWRSEYMKELLHDDDVREEGRAEGENLLLALISRMSIGGDADKAVQLSNPKIMKEMRQKYGM